MAHKGVTLWLTGLSGAGKSTIADILDPKLREIGMKVESLDGDVIRTNLGKGLGFSKEDRDLNVLRVGFVCDLLTRNGVVVIASLISPYAEIRQKNRELIGDFIEVFVSTPIEECAKRDPKGLYKKAYAGEIKGFTGIDDPYEAPTTAEIVLDTQKNTAEECADIVIKYMIEKGYLPSGERAEDSVYSEEEEAEVKKRLEDLGYI